MLSGYEGYYKISNHGRIKNRFDKILKPANNSRGYLRIDLKINSRRKRFFIHRLVAEHFLEKKFGCNIVNHLDCNPQNNKSENLEWTTLKGNSEHMGRLGRNKRTETWLKRLSETQRLINGKRVIATSLIDGSTLEYEIVRDVKKDGFQPSSVSLCCNKKRLTHKGYTWRFLDE